MISIHNNAQNQDYFLIAKNWSIAFNRLTFTYGISSHSRYLLISFNSSLQTELHNPFGYISFDQSETINEHVWILPNQSADEVRLHEHMVWLVIRAALGYAPLPKSYLHIGICWSDTDINLMHSDYQLQPRIPPIADCFALSCY